MDDIKWSMCGYFIMCLSEKWFEFLLRYIRFDDIRGREERKKFDKITHGRWLFESFVLQYKQSYSLSELVTIDERLQAFHGRCSFRQYIPFKPAKYGIKIFAMVDNISYFTSNMNIYAGKQPDGSFSTDSSLKNVVNRLIQPIRKIGRNVEIDNWFTSVQLADELLSQKLNLLGTIRKNKIQIPPAFKITKNHSVFSFYLGFCEKKF